MSNVNKHLSGKIDEKNTFRYQKSNGNRLGKGGIRIDPRAAGPVAFLLRQNVLELDTAFRAVVTEGWERFHIEVPGLRLVQLSPRPLAFAHRQLSLAHYLRRGSRGHLDNIFVLRECDDDAYRTYEMH